MTVTSPAVDVADLPICLSKHRTIYLKDKPRLCQGVGLVDILGDEETVVSGLVYAANSRPSLNPGTGGGNGPGNLTTRDNWGRGASGDNKDVTSAQKTGTARASVRYTNPRTGKTTTLTRSG